MTYWRMALAEDKNKPGKVDWKFWMRGGTNLSRVTRTEFSEMATFE